MSNYKIAPYSGNYYSPRTQYPQTFRTPSNGRQYTNRPQKKHSGCRMKMSKDGTRVVVYGWKYNRKVGMISVVGIENKNSNTKNDRWYKMTFNLTNKNSGQTQTVPGLWDKQRNRAVLGTIGWVCSPNAPNGGYIGQGGYKMNVKR